MLPTNIQGFQRAECFFIGVGDVPQRAVSTTLSCINLYTNSSFVMFEFHIYARAQVEFIRFLFLLIKLKAPRAYLRLVGRYVFRGLRCRSSAGEYLCVYTCVL